MTGVTAFQNAVILKPDIRLEQPLECGVSAPLWICPACRNRSKAGLISRTPNYTVTTMSELAVEIK